MTLQSLHDHEIAGKIEWLYDENWRVSIGDPVHASATVKSEAEALAWLRAKAKEHYGVEIEDRE